MPRPPSICVLPYGHHQRSGLHATPLNDLAWPLGRPEWLEDGTVADLGPDDHLILYPRTLTHFRRRASVRCKVSLMVVEPSVIHGRHLKLLRMTWRRFFRVLSFNEELLAHIPNGIFFPYGTTWVPGWRELDVSKSRMCSLIASANRDGIAANVAQQFEIGRRIAAAGLIPILEPEIDINAADKAECERILLDEIEGRLAGEPFDTQLMFKLTIPETDGFYTALIEHPLVLRVVALSGGYSRVEANERLARNPGLIASFSRALTEGLNVDQTPEEFDALLADSIASIYAASTT